MIPIPIWRHRPRRKHPAVDATCALCGRNYERLFQLREYCSRACRRLDVQRKARGR